MISYWASSVLFKSNFFGTEKVIYLMKLHPSFFQLSVLILWNKDNIASWLLLVLDLSLIYLCHYHLKNHLWNLEIKFGFNYGCGWCHTPVTSQRHTSVTSRGHTFVTSRGHTPYTLQDLEKNSLPVCYFNIDCRSRPSRNGGLSLF